MSPRLEDALCELWYEPSEPGSESPVLRDLSQRLPTSLLLAWQQELDSRVEQLRQDRSATVRFQKTLGDWPAEWTFEDRTEARARIPRIRLTATRVRYASPALKSDSRPVNSLPTHVAPPIAVAATPVDWVSAWLDELRAALTQPPTDRVAETCLEYARETLRTLGRQSPRETALLVFQSHLIFAIWKAQQAQDDDRSHRLAIALQEILRQASAPSAEGDTSSRPAGTASTMTSTLVSAIQMLVGGVLPSRKPAPTT